METVFITIHDLSLDARIKYCSDSIEDILGYLPYEVKGKSCWEYFHPDEIPFARAIHGRGIDLDKAAVLNYCRIKHRDGSWIGCECVFTVVHDVLVASTSVYRRGAKARKRALDGAGVRRIFSSSPRDPRYHMLSYLSNKFYQEPSPHSREPRAALFLNRFTRTSTIMYATNGVSNILGLQPDQLIGKSFYYCIAENCLSDAVKCLESAKANDSIAYLRFWYRDPLQEDNRTRSTSMPDAESEEDDDGGVPLRSGSRSSVDMLDGSTPQIDGVDGVDGHTVDGNDSRPTPSLQAGTEPSSLGDRTSPSRHHRPQVDGDTNSTRVDGDNSRSSSGNSSDFTSNGADGIFDPPTLQRSGSSMTPQEEHDDAIEIEAVVSCTSDGLVVILRKARPLVPHALGATDAPFYANGLFASPWAPEPVMPPEISQVTVAPTMSFPATPEPAEAGFMAAIRDVAVFAWSLTGINGSLAQFAHGKPSGESLPPGGLPIWDPNANADPHNIYNGFAGSAHRPLEGMGEPTSISKKEDELTSSDDEVVWKRAPTMSTWRRPKRRGHQDAFGADGVDGVDGQNEDGGRKRVSKSLEGAQ